MKFLMGFVLLGLTLCAVACSTSPRAPLATSVAPHAKTAAQVAQAPAGFDNGSNGVTDEPTHQADLASFEAFEGIPDGLGPLYNAQSCRECHQSPVSGGVSQIMELRVGHKGADGTFQTAEIPINHGSGIIKGRTLVNLRAICPSAAFPTTEIQERVPDSETIRTFRTSLSILGDGFVEAIADSTLTDISDKQCKQEHGKICGLVLYVPILESPGVTRVGRFGWKNEHASLLSFSADAYLNEMGITSPLQPTENTSNGNEVPDDGIVDDEGGDVELFALFMRSLKVPPRYAELASTPDAIAGSALFNQVGCNVCHTRSMVTADAETPINGGAMLVSRALGNKRIQPFGDFLLHDIGTGDGIVQNGGASTRNKVRTAPLWGLHARTRFMHDFLSHSIDDAIQRHGNQAEGTRRAFNGLNRADQRRLMTFLRSL